MKFAIHSMLGMTLPYAISLISNINFALFNHQIWYILFRLECSYQAYFISREITEMGQEYVEGGDKMLSFPKHLLEFGRWHDETVLCAPNPSRVCAGH